MSHYEEIFLVGLVRKSYFILEKHNEKNFTVITLYKMIFRKNAKTGKLHLIVASNNFVV